MKKVSILAFVLAVVLSLTMLAGCGGNDILANPDKEYFVTGQFAGWGDAFGKAEYKMTATSLNDEALTSVKSSLKGAKYLYIIKGVVIADSGAGWEADYVVNGEVAKADGNQSLKFLQGAVGGEAPDWWGQSPESGEFKNLTPDTLWIPGYTETPEVGPDWNGNMVILKAGTYTIVLAVFGDYKAAGVIAE